MYFVKFYLLWFMKLEIGVKCIYDYNEIRLKVFSVFRNKLNGKLIILFVFRKKFWDFLFIVFNIIEKFCFDFIVNWLGV